MFVQFHECETSANGTREINQPHTGLNELLWDFPPLFPSNGLRLAMKIILTEEQIPTMHTDL